MLPKLTTSLDLEDLALELGGSVARNDGSVFNAGGRMGAQRLRRVAPAEKPDPVPAPPPAPGPDIGAILQSLADKIQPTYQTPMLPVESPPVQVVVQPAAKTSWRFDFERNPDKSIKSITATPI